MSRAHGTLEVFALAVVVASSAIYAGCGGGSGDVTGPPGGGGSGTVDSLVLSLDSADVIVGDTIRIVAEARDANGQVVPGIRLSFSTSDPAVATVTDDGLVTAVDFGEAEIAVGIAGEASLRSAPLAPSYSAVTVNSRSTFRMRGVPRIVITPGEQTLDQGVTSQYSASVTNVRGQGLTRVRMRWSSSDPSIAGIDATGLVTTQNEGDTDIRVTVTAGDGISTPLEITERVPLHVAVCGGIFQVASWTVGADLLYKTGGHHAPTRSTYVVDQRSTAGAYLTEVPVHTGSDSMVWEGTTSGTYDNHQVRLNNSVSFPVPPPLNTGVTREAAAGAIVDDPTAIARLTIRRPTAGSNICTYDFQFRDYFTWDVTNNQGAPARPVAGPTGVARVIGKEVGARRESGGWQLGGFEPADAVQLPARAFANLAPASDYTVGSTIGIQMILQLGGASATFGEATFSYVITGNLR